MRIPTFLRNRRWPLPDCCIWARTNERTNLNKSIEDRLIEIVRVNSTISKTALAHELEIGRTKLYELLGTMTHRVRSTGGTRHVEWTVLED